VEERRATDMRRKSVLVILVSLVILLAFISGCASAVGQTRQPYTYSTKVYNAAKISPTTEQEALDFLAEDTTDKNPWVRGIYECGHFAADLWWNAYEYGLEACLVWVTYSEQGIEQVHWIVKLRIEDEGQCYWLWVEPSTDEVVDEGDYTVQGTYCGEQALNLCRTWWEEGSDP